MGKYMACLPSKGLCAAAVLTLMALMSWVVSKGALLLLEVNNNFRGIWRPY